MSVLWAVTNAWNLVVTTVVKVRSGLTNLLHPTPRSWSSSALHILRLWQPLMSGSFPYDLVFWGDSSDHCLLPSHCGYEECAAYTNSLTRPWWRPAECGEVSVSELLELHAVCLLTELCSINVLVNLSVYTFCVSRGASLVLKYEVWFSFFNVQGVGGEEALFCWQSSW